MTATLEKSIHYPKKLMGDGDSNTKLRKNGADFETLGLSLSPHKSAGDKIGVSSPMLENLIQAEKIVRAMLEMQPATRAEREFSEVLNHLLDLIAQTVDQLQEGKN